MSDEATKLKNQGNEAFQQEKFQESIDLFTKAIALDPKNHVLFSNRSASHAKLEQYEEALQDAEATIAIKPDWAKGYSRKGAALYGMGDLDKAEEAYKKGLELEPSNAALRQGFQDVKVAKASSGAGADRLNQMFGRLFTGDVMGKVRAHPETSAFLNQPDYVAMLNDIIANPNNVTKHIKDQRIMATFGMLAQSEMSKQPQPGAANAPQQQPQFTPKQEAESPKQPQPQQQEVPKPAPEPSKPAPETPKQTESPKQSTQTDLNQDAEAEKEKGNAAYKQRKFDEALHHYNKAIEINPSITYYNNKGAVYFEMGKFDECIQTCVEGIEQGRKARADYSLVAKAYARIANAYLKQDKLTESIEAFNKSLTEHRTKEVVESLKKTEKLKEERDRQAYIDPEKSRQAKERGNESFKQGRFPEAVKEYTEAIKRNPTDAVLYSNRAAAYTKLAAYPEGLKDCEEALKLDPKFVKAYTRKGHLLFFMKEFNRAIASYERGLELEPENKELKEGMERTFIEMQKQQQTMTPEERLKQAAKDPEVQEILSDPTMRVILEQMQTNPKAIQEHAKNPMVMKKLQKLIEAGVISTRSH